MENKYDEIMQRLDSRQLPKHRILDESDIAIFEQRIFARLPGDYRHFLTKYALTSAAQIGFPDPARPERRGGTVEVFYGIQPHYYDLFSGWCGMQKNYPGFLPIADSPGGCIGLYVYGNKRGQVFCWDRDEEWDEWEKNLNLIAADFDTFLRSLRKFEYVPPPPPPPPTPLSKKENRFDAVMQQLGIKTLQEYREVGEVDLAWLEGQLGLKLPEDYRHFLEKYGGTTPTTAGLCPGPYVETGPPAPFLEKPKKIPGKVSTFFGVVPQGLYDVLRFWKTSQRDDRPPSCGRIPAEYLPICNWQDARHQIGRICLGIEGAVREKVYLYRLPVRIVVPEIRKVLYFDDNPEWIAPDFSSFLRMLVPSAAERL